MAGFLSNEKGKHSIMKHFLKLRKEMTKGRATTMD